MAYRQGGRPSTLLPLIAWLWLSVATSIAAAQDEQDYYLLDFHSDGYLLAESVPAYASGNAFMIDFALFLDAVEFPITHEGNLWSGWFRSEDRNFAWRMDLGLVQIADRHGERVENDQWVDDVDGTYVSTDALESWFGLELDVDPRSQVMTVSSVEPLPFQLWRNRMLARYRYRPGQHTDADVIVPDQYHWATSPLVNLSTHFLTQGHDDGRNSSGTASLAMGMDLLQHSVIYTGAITDSSDNSLESNNRLTIERASLTPETPIFAGIHHYILGDIYEDSSTLVVSSDTGRGFRIGRYAAGRSANVSTVTITGNAPPGWDVELYRNGALIEFATVGADGRYFFPDQETPFGENLFVAKLFGPQGQTREDRQVHWAGGAELAAGDYDFSISHIDFDRTLLDGVPANAAGLPASHATTFRYAKALTADLQLGASYTRAGLGTTERDGTYTDADYLTLFGSTRVGPGLLVGEAAQELGSGQAWRLEYLTSFHDQQVTFAHRGYNNYQSPATIHREDIDALNELSVFGAFGGDKQYSYTLGLRHSVRSEGPSDLRLFNRLSMRLGRLNLTNDLEHSMTAGPDRTTGHLRLASRIRGVTLRGQLDYLLTDSQVLRQISATANWDMGERLNNNLTVSQNLAVEGQTFLTNLLSVRIRDYDLTLSMSSNFDGAWSAGAGFNMAFGYDRHRRAFITDNGGLATTGRATMHLFIDDDNDGIRDPGEAPVPWAKYRDQESLETMPGTLPLTALPTERPVLFDMQNLTLDDPFLSPRARAYELTTHAGSDVSIDVAVVMTGDIEGHVVADESGSRGARGIVVVLYDKDGREVARTRSEFDGYYSFTGVPTGDYEVRVYADGGRKELVQPLTLSPKDGYVVLERIYVFE